MWENFISKGGHVFEILPQKSGASLTHEPRSVTSDVHVSRDRTPLGTRLSAWGFNITHRRFVVLFIKIANLTNVPGVILKNRLRKTNFHMEKHYECNKWQFWCRPIHKEIATRRELITQVNIMQWTQNHQIAFAVKLIINQKWANFNTNVISRSVPSPIRVVIKNVMSPDGWCI